MSSLFLEDFSVGQVFRSEPFRLTAADFADFAAVSGDRHPMHLPSDDADLASLIGHGPLGLARYFGTVFESGIIQDTVIGLLETNWRYLLPLKIGANLRFETVVTGWRRTSDPERGVLRRAVRLLDDNARVVQEGEAVVLVRAERETHDGDPVSADPLSLPWARELVSRLEANSEFHDSAQLFDGTIALAGETHDLQFRVYKGEVIDVAKRTPAGPTFTLQARDLVWAQFLTGSHNDFVARTTRSEFSVSGNVYAYLQLTKALHLLLDAGRSIHETGTDK